MISAYQTKYWLWFLSIGNTVHLNLRETLNGLSIIPMTNTSSHIMATLNPAHISDGAGSYFVSGMYTMKVRDLASTV